MKKLKAKQWEMISEGIVSVDEIMSIQDNKSRQPITLTLMDATRSKAATIQITVGRGPIYRVFNNTSNVGLPSKEVTKRPYKYLSCAVRRAVKEYKTAIRTGNWKMLVK